MADTPPDYFELLDIITLQDCGGDPSAFFNAVYDIYKKDFIDSKPVYRGTRLGVKRMPLVDGKDCTFYHLTHNGEIENDRMPDMRRMERISWPRPIIDQSTHPYLKVWRNQRQSRVGMDDRILIFHEDEDYLVVLADRGNYILPWTAYYVEYPNRKRKLLREYEAFLNAETAK